MPSRALSGGGGAGYASALIIACVSNANRSLGDAKQLYARHLMLDRLRRVPEVDGALRIQPELW